MANTTMPSRLFLEPDNQYEITPTYHSEPHSPSQSEHSNSTFSSYGHTRMSSSTSSYSSSPPSEQRSSMLKRSALPDVAEDPHERASQPVRGTLSFDLDIDWHRPPQITRSSLDAQPHTLHNYRNEFFTDRTMASSQLPKRHNSAFNRLTNRVFQRLPNSMRAPRNPRVMTTQSAPCSEVTSPVTGRSRSNSRTRPLFRRSGSDLGDNNVDPSKMSTSIDTIAEDDGVEMTQESALEKQDELEAPNSIMRTSTPLLPLMMDENMANHPIKDSTLQPPNVATSSVVPTPHGTPQMRSHDSPALSSKASWAHIDHSQKDSMSPSWEMPAMFPAEPSDEWSDKLGHADFHIVPRPYRPDICNQQSCRALLGAWEKARAEYSKHLCRTSTHYGNTSRTYRLTEMKWESIDATWRQNYEWTQSRARENGEAPPPDSPSEPAPVVKIPSVDEKFPQISDEGIVGPMEQVSPPVRRQPSMKAQIFRIFDGLRGRSSSSL